MNPKKNQNKKKRNQPMKKNQRKKNREKKNLNRIIYQKTELLKKKNSKNMLNY